MISPIGTGYGYYSAGYASSATRSASRTAMATALSQNGSPVSPVEKVPEVFSNAETTRIPRTPEELQAERANAYDIMNSQTPRNAEHVNAPFELKSEKPTSPEECETCKNRKYVDGSNEGNVSFKSPGHISPEASASVVKAHEYEHVGNAVAEGNKPDAELVSVSVSLRTAICPECGTTYVAGGETRTAIRRTPEQSAYEQMKELFADFASGRKGLDFVA
ncbi:MAG: hypothetical protein ACI4FZ_13555 [Lachnospiraceae bacterium]